VGLFRRSHELSCGDSLSFGMVAHNHLPNLFRATVHLGTSPPGLGHNLPVGRQALFDGQFRTGISREDIESRWAMAFRQMGHKCGLVWGIDRASLFGPEGV
jgi:hypothetical protein